MHHFSTPGFTSAPRDEGPSNKKLLARIAVTKDEPAFDTLFQRYGRMVWSICWRRLHHRQDAEDAFQQTFRVVMRKAKPSSLWSAATSLSMSSFMVVLSGFSVR